jgi:hypothetical protein
VRSDASAFRPTQLSAYCGQLSIALGDLEKAATQTDLEALTGGIAVLEPVVDTTMVMVNTELFSTAAQVPLQVLGDELGRVAELLRSADLPASIPEPVPGLPADLPRLLPTFERGISSLRELNTRLTGLVRIHNELQLMETVTKSIEGPTVSAADIRPKWKGLRAKADLLNAIPGADWLAVLCGMIGVVNDTLQAATTNPTDRRSLSALRNAFNDFRSQLVTDFHETDTKLRQFVSDVQNIRDPVEKAIEGLKR